MRSGLSSVSNVYKRQTEHIVTETFVTDDAAANSVQMNVGGTIYFGAIPGQGFVYERYLGILCVTATTTTTAGTINAFLTFDPSTASAYKDLPDATN